MRKQALRSLFLAATGAALFGGSLTSSAALAEDPQPIEEQVIVVQVEDSQDEGDKKDAPKLWLGIQLKSIDGDLATYLGSKSGILVDAVFPDSPAEKAGIQVGDILIEAGGKKLAEPQALLEVLSERGIEDVEPLGLTLLRKGKETQLEVTPKERPKSDAPSWTAKDSEELHLHLGLDTDAVGRVHDLLQQLDNKQVRVLRFGNPLVVSDEADAKTEDIDVNIVKSDDGDRIEVTVKKKNNEPAEITVKHGDETQEFTESELDAMPKEMRVLVAPILEGKRQIRVFSPNADGQNKMLQRIYKVVGEGGKINLNELEQVVRMQATADEVREKVEERVEEIAEQTKESREEIADAVRGSIRQARESAAKAIAMPREIQELRSLVDQLRAEVKELREQLNKQQADD